MSIFLVQSNLKHDGVNFAKGSFIQGDADQFDILVQDRVLKLVEGANTMDEAKEMVDIEKESEPAEEKAPQPKDTWGPTAEKTEEKTTEPEAADAADTEPAQTNQAAPANDPQIDSNNL